MTFPASARGMKGVSIHWLLMAVERVQKAAVAIGGIDRDALVAQLFDQEGAALVRLARLSPTIAMLPKILSKKHSSVCTSRLTGSTAR